MSVAVHAELKDWRVLWEQLKEKDPSLSVCVKVAELKHVPDEIFYEVCAYVERMSRWDDVVPMIGCFLAMAKRKKNKQRDRMLEQWFGMIKFMLADKRIESPDRGFYWTQLLPCAEKRYAERAWQWFGRQNSLLRLWNNLSEVLGKVMYVHPDIGEMIVQKILDAARNGEHSLLRMRRVREWTKVVAQRDAAIGLILEYVTAYEEMVVARDLFEVFLKFPEWRGRVMACVEQNEVKDQTLLRNLVSMCTPYRMRAWALFEKHQGNNVVAMGDLLLLLSVCEDDEAYMVACEVWNSVRSRLSMSQLCDLVKQSMSLREGVIEEIVSRPYDEGVLWNVLSTTHVPALTRAIVASLLSHGCTETTKKSLRKGYSDLMDEFSPKDVESASDVYMAMVRLDETCAR